MRLILLTLDKIPKIPTHIETEKTKKPIGPENIKIINEINISVIIERVV